MSICRRALVLVSAVASVALITTGASAAPAWAQAAARAASVPGSLALTALSFSQSSVDATSGNATVTLNWTVTDSNLAAADVAGEVDIRLAGAQPFTYVGVTYPAPFDLTGSVTGQGQGNPSGTVHDASFSYTFSVPQYASSSTAHWVVSSVALQDDQGDTQSLDGPHLASFSAASPHGISATELVDTTPPTYDSLQFANFSQRPFVYSGSSTPIAYTLEVLDPQSGFWQGSLTLQGPGGQKERGTFDNSFDEFNQVFTCEEGLGIGLTDTFCNVSVTIPAGAAAGTWTVSTIQLTDNAGNTATYRNVDALPITVTANKVVTATGFSASPDVVNDWQNDATSTLSFTVSGAVGGVSAVYVDAASPNGDFCAQQGTEFTVSGDTISVPLVIGENPQFGDGTVDCSLTGVAIVDGQGDVTLYGTEYGAPAPSPAVNITQVPDTPPVLASVSLSPASVPESTSAQVVSLDFTSGNNLAAVNFISASLYDSSGNLVGGGSFDGFLGSNSSNGLLLFIPASLPPGVYTVGMTLIDFGNLVTTYGPGGQPMPGGPLQLTVTSP
jgi:hypothetical protein